MKETNHSPRKLSVLLGEKTLKLVDEIATAEGRTKASWARQVIRQRLREIAAAQNAGAAA